MNERLFQRLIAKDWMASKKMLNFAPIGWWECDVFELTKAGYYREYEIKISRSDFFHDANKEREHWPKGGGVWDPVTKSYPPRIKETKHELLAQRDVRGPVQFWYVTPEALVEPREIPTWAGLIEVIKCHGDRWWQKEKKTAPRLHKTKCSPRVVAQLHETCYYRYHNLLQNRNK